MSANSFGQLFRITTFGESHGAALGVVVEGCPAGIEFQPAVLNRWLERRRPGQSALTSARQESDQAEILSGVFAERTLGTPIAMIVRNQDARSADYQPEQMQMRAGHATDLWQSKFTHTDPRGSGRASGRETVARVMGAAVAQMFIESLHPQLRVLGFARALGPLQWDGDVVPSVELQALIDSCPSRFPDRELDQRATELLSKAKAEGESFGGVAEVHITGLPAGLGQPVFHKLKADLAQGVMSIGATCGFEIGEGFGSAQRSGQDFHSQAQQYGGQRGGISTGGALNFRVAFKPTATRGEMAQHGRHDPCIVPRALPVVEAMAYLVIADHLLWSRLDR